MYEKIARKVPTRQTRYDFRSRSITVQHQCPKFSNGFHTGLSSLWTGSLFGEKNSEERKRKGGKRACRQTFEAAIPPSCSYPAEHLSVRSLSVNQFRARVTPGKLTGNEQCFAPSENKVKWTASQIVDFAKSRWSLVRELIRCRSLAGWQWPRERCICASIWILKISPWARLDYQPLFGKMSPHSFPDDLGDGGNRAYPWARRKLFRFKLLKLCATGRSSC